MKTKEKKIKGVLSLLLAFFMICSMEEAFAQNDKHRFVLADTTGPSNAYEFMMTNVNLEGAFKISFFRKVNGEESPIKEIGVGPVGAFFLLTENGTQKVMKNAFVTTVKIPKTQAEGTSGLYYRIHKRGDAETHPIVVHKN